MRDLVRVVVGHLALLVNSDAIIAATFATGSLLYDDRLAIAPGLSANQYLGLVAVGAVVALLLASERRWFLEEFPAMMLMTIAAFGLLTLPSPALDYAWEKWFQFASFGILAIAWTYRSRAIPGGDWTPLLLLGGVGLVLGLSGLVSYLTGGSGQRLAVFGGGPIVYARWVSTSFLIYSVWILATARRWRWLTFPFLVPVAIGFVLVIVLAGSKGPLLAFLASGAYVFNALLRSWSRSGRILVLLGVLVICSSLALALEPTIVVRYVLDPTAEVSQGSWGKRAAWIAATPGHLDRLPWYGGGLGSWAMLTFHLDATKYPHNLIVEVLVEAGLVIGGLFIAFWAWRTSCWWRRLNRWNTSQSLVIKGLIICWGVNVLFSGDLNDSRILFLLLGLLWAAAHPARGGAKPSGRGGGAAGMPGQWPPGGGTER